MRLILFTIILVACGKSQELTTDTAEGWRPDVVCPGDAGCLSGEGELSAGAAAVSITPTCWEKWLDCGEDEICPGDPNWVAADPGESDGDYDKQSEAFLDCGCDQLCEGDEGYAGPDEGESDGLFRSAWMAGFNNGRPANAVHDDIWARTIALRQGETTVAIVALDVVGFFFDDVEEIRTQVNEAGVDVDHVIISSTHNHEAPDTLGQWGRQVGERGVDEAWMSDLKLQVVESVERAVANIESAELLVASVDVSTEVPEKGTRNLINDTRDPRIVDETMGVAWLRSSADGATIATLVSFGNHPEALASRNVEITSDFAHYIRDGMENGVEWDSNPVAGLGGVSVYLQAAVGGMMTPLRAEVTDRNGDVFSESTFEKAEAIGHVMASQALDALAVASVETAPDLTLRATEVFLPIHNFAFQAMFLMGVFERDAYNYDPEAPLDQFNVPELKTEMDFLGVGPIRILSVPGELLPELAVGGFDGSHTNIGNSEDPIVDLEQPNAPDLAAAPAGPYLKERMGGAHNWILGLGNDELGYIIPEYNFVLDEQVAYLREAEGDHYEETNSLGPATAGLVEEWAMRLIEWGQ
jgi:hypothetical protein